MIVACLGCSIISFFVGLNIPHESSEQSSNPQTVEQDEDSKYIGIYVYSYYQNGIAQSSRVYLNENHDCKGPDTDKYYSCTWSIQDGKVVTAIKEILDYSAFETLEECEARMQNYAPEYRKNYEIVEFDNDYYKKKNGYACAIRYYREIKYDVLADGSLLSEYGGDYAKRK